MGPLFSTVLKRICGVTAVVAVLLLVFSQIVTNLQLLLYVNSVLVFSFEHSYLALPTIIKSLARVIVHISWTSYCIFGFLTRHRNKRLLAYISVVEE
jgi:hypothetical protein